MISPLLYVSFFKSNPRSSLRNNSSHEGANIFGTLENLEDKNLYRSVLTAADLQTVKKNYGFPLGVVIRLPIDQERMN